MIILLMGPTASGKTTLSRYLCSHGFDPVVRATTRPIRDTEIHGVDYHFMSVPEFLNLVKQDKMIEYEEYSDSRYYGTTYDSLRTSDNLCSTITPSGFLQICSSGTDLGEILLVYCKCSLKTQILRYVSRIIDFTVSDKLEMCDRLARDEGMFKGISGIVSAGKAAYPGKVTYMELDMENTVEYAFASIKLVLDGIKERNLK